MAVKQQSAERVRREIIQLCHTGLDSQTLRVEIVARLRKVIPIDASFFATADPATLLFTGAVSDELLERVTPQFLENEFLQDDVNKFFTLARSATPVGSLVQATQGQWMHSRRYEDILAPLSLGDELRAALIASGVCWGFLCLHRDQSSPILQALRRRSLINSRHILLLDCAKLCCWGAEQEPSSQTSLGCFCWPMICRT
jgi:hypothetical protein